MAGSFYRRIRRPLERSSEHGLRVAAEHVLGVSNSHVPLEEGELMRSGRVATPSRQQANVVYDSVYARYQHERLDLRHAPGRTAKYLENALRSERQVTKAIIADAIRRGWR